MHAPLVALADSTSDFSSSTSLSSQKKSSYKVNIVRRDLNIDHWDLDTLIFYLGFDNKRTNIFEKDGGKHLNKIREYAGIDAAVMFYAQWCRVCHAFVPIWDTIASLLYAGTTRGNLVMALFDCELNEQHMKICDIVGVEKYPTLMYLGVSSFHESDSFWDLLLCKDAKFNLDPQNYKLSRAVTFQGDLNVGDSVLDWIKAMKALSSWNSLAIDKGDWIRSFRKTLWNILNLRIFKNLTKKKEPSNLSYLPVGIPYYRENLTFYPMAVKWELNMLEDKIKSFEIDLESYKLATKNGDLFIESFLFPPQVKLYSHSTYLDKNVSKDHSGVNVTTINADPFEVMNDTMAWDVKTGIVISPQKNKHEAIILKSCLIDTITNYCNRLFTRVTSQFISTLKTVPIVDYPNIINIEKEIRTSVEEKEPYCIIFQNCLVTDFKLGEEETICRPIKCPFVNSNACVYVSGCLSDSIKTEYSQILNQ